MIIQEEIQVSPKKEPIEEVIIQEEIQAPPMKEPIKEVTFELEDPVILGPVVEEAVENDFEELPDFQTGERILADLRIIMRDEPRPIDFITKILKEKHNFSHRDVNALIDHVASPFSICKTLNDDLFQRFIRSLEVEKESGEGVEIWTQVIQIIGFETLSEGQLVDIYNMFMGDVKKKNQRVITIALLLHALPERFDRWWKKEMIPDYISEKYDSDYNFYLDKGFSEDVVEEAIILLCAYAIERPELVAKEYTYAKHEAGKNHENKTEEWLKKGGGKIEYITESQIQKLQGEKYGGKFVNPRITPDILLKVPIQLSEEGQHIHWIDAKKQFIDPSLSPEYKVTSFCNQLNKYVKNYGPGLIVWGKNFSEEWNEATKGVVQHIKI